MEINSSVPTVPHSRLNIPVLQLLYSQEETQQGRTKGREGGSEQGGREERK